MEIFIRIQKHLCCWQILWGDFIWMKKHLSCLHTNSVCLQVHSCRVKCACKLGAVAVSRKGPFCLLHPFCNFWGNKSRVMSWQQGITWCNDKGRPIQWQACQYSEKLCLAWVYPTQRCFTKQNAHPGAGVFCNTKCLFYTMPINKTEFSSARSLWLFCM